MLTKIRARRTCMYDDNIGDRIKKIRKELSLSQKEFAKALGISQSAVSSYEKKQRTPPESLIRLIVGIYNININYLLNNELPIFITQDQTFKVPNKLQVFEDFCRTYNLDYNSQKLLEDLINLPDNHIRIVQEFIKFIKDINKS